MTFPKRNFLQQIAFHAGDEGFTWQDIFVAARLTGNWQTLEDRTARSIDCRHKLAEQGEELSSEDLDQAGNEFRYARDLISAEELEAWLNKKELTVDEWFDYIERSASLKMHEDETFERNFDPADEEFLDYIEIDGICSGEFHRFASELAGQAALAASDHKVSIAEADVDHTLNTLPGELKNYPGIRRLIRLKLNLQGYESEFITEERIRERVKSEPLDFIRYGLRTLTFSDGSQASEAALCIREDGERPSQVSSFAGAKLENSSGYLEDLHAAYRNQLAGARPGECIGPLATSTGQFILIYVNSKNPPSMDDPEVRSRAKRKLLESVINYEINNRIRWHMQ